MNQKNRFKNPDWNDLPTKGVPCIFVEGEDLLSKALEFQGVVYEDMPWTELKINQKGV